MLGSNQWRDMQGAEIAQKHHIVVVSVAYRLGVFGYMHNKARILGGLFINAINRKDPL